MSRPEPILPTHAQQLDNGLTVVVREQRASPVVAIVTHVKAGYFDEPDALAGVSHVVEHMYFKGTARRESGDMARETKRAGGYLNAGTIYDHTSYYTVLPASALERGLDIQSDALRHSRMDEAELRRELEVIIQEAKRKLDNPSAVAAETLYALMFDAHPMRRWRIGTEAGLRALTREDVWSYYRAMYRPSNIVLSIVGDVDIGRIFGLVQRYYGDMAAGDVAHREPTVEPPHRGLRLREMDGDVAQSYVEWGWRTPGTLHPDTPALDLLSVVLGQGRASRLYRAVREPGHASAVSAYNYTPTEIGVFGVSADVPQTSTAAAVDVIGREMTRAARAEAGAAETQRAKNILEARLLRRLETVEGQATLLAEWQALGDWRLADDYMERMLATAPADLGRVAREYLDPGDASVVVYRPREAPALGFDADDLSRRMTAAAAAGPTAPAAAPAEGPAAGAAVGAAVGAAAASAPGIASRVRRTERVADVQVFRLGSGVPLVVRPRRSSALVSMGVSCQGGVLLEASGQAGLTGLMVQTSVKGTSARTAAELAEATEALGGAIAPGAAADVLGWSLSVPSRHFERGFELLSDVVLRPSFPEPELQRERAAALSELERLRDDMHRYPLRLFLEAAFEGHAYGWTATQLEASLRGLSRAQLSDWHRDHVLGASPWVFVVGDVDPEDIAARVDALLPAFESAAPRTAGARPPAWPEHGRRLERQRDTAQTALVIGFPGPDRRDPDIFAMQVLSNALSGLGGRFFTELREKRSLAYTVSAYPITRWLAGAFVAYIATTPEREDEARRGLVEGFERLAEDGLTDEELERARRFTIGSWQIHNQTNGAHLSALSDAMLLGHGVKDVLEFEDRIRAVSRDSVRAAVRRRFDPDRLVEGIVRGTGGGR